MPRAGDKYSQDAPRNANWLEREEESVADDQPILSSHFRESPPVMITGG